MPLIFFFFFSSRRRHTRSYGDWSSDVCSSDLDLCRFHPRCRYATEICSQVEPPLTDYGNNHLAACHHPLNVDEATLRRVQVAPETPRPADESALPEDTSGKSRPVPEQTNP